MEVPRLVVDVGMGILFPNQRKFEPDTDIPPLDGKVIVVTGGTLYSHDTQHITYSDDTIGNNGLGKETVKRLAKHNPALIFLCSRNAKKAEDAIKEIESEHAFGRIKTLQLDLASFESISSAAKSFNSQSDRLDILINNAGIMGVPDSKTKEGYEIQLGTNHLGHALFTKLLLPTMLKTAEQKDSDVRIINLSSQAHARAPAPGFSTEDVDAKNSNPMARYGRSKLANVLFVRQLAKKYPQITSVSLHPGVINTDLFTPMFASNRVLGTLSGFFGWVVYSTVPDGAKNTLWAATAPKDQVKSGQYYLPIGREDAGSTYSRDEKMAESLWDWTEQEINKHKL